MRKKQLPDLSDEEFRELYRAMLTIRIMDGRMLNLQRQGRIGFYGPATGQEATIVACAKSIRETDWVVPALREGAIAMMRGLSMNSAIDQLIGNGSDRCKGRQMPCHYSLRSGNFVAMSSVIGTQISHATGLAMAARYRATDEVVLGFLGDGATSANDFHAGLNFAGVYKVPVVFVCQNNQWSISLPVDKQTASESMAAKARAYGLPGVIVDGNDVLAVLQVVKGAVARARKGGGPTLIEAMTYRLLGHSSSDDPGRYRDAAEVEMWEKRDPIQRYRRFLVSSGFWNEEEETGLRDKVAGEIGVAIREAEEAPELDPETLIGDVLSEVDPRLSEHFRDAGISR